MFLCRAGTGTSLKSVPSWPRSQLLEADRPVSPSVTVVFAAVEGGKQLVRKNEHVAKLIHNVISRVMQVGPHLACDCYHTCHFDNHLVGKVERLYR